MENNGALVAFLCFVEEDMVAPECLAERIGVRTGEILLPVEPPEVYAFLLVVADDCREERLCEIRPIETPIDIILAIVEILT